MSLLSVADLSFRYVSQSEPLFEQVAFDISPGDRIGLVGPNGAGKTTLLRILTGALDPTGGRVSRRHGLRIGYIPQESPAPRDERLDEYILSAHPGLGPLRTQLRALEPHLDDPTSAVRYANVLNDYETQGGFHAEAEAARILDGLGFDERERALATASLSSGQRARAELARLLLAPADLLLIDEPTNHLDIPGREWLEAFLARIEAAYLMVSHDRVFLSRATRRIFELRRGGLTIYEGNYTFYREQRAVLERQEWERYEGRQKRIRAAERASERRMKLGRRVVQKPGGGEDRDHLGRKAAKVMRTARILRERVFREPPIPKPWEEDPIPTLDFPNVVPTDGTPLQVVGLRKTYGDKCLFEGLSFRVARGERWAVLGPNGCGKTTLLRILLGDETPDAGEVLYGGRLRFGYYAQEGEDLDPNRTPVELCRDVSNDETWNRTILGCLRLRGDEPNRPVGTMSAGERGKIALARLLLGGANVLLLDEPTNHLDVEAREAVETTLAQFPGTILFVSHDRSFIDALADETLDLGSR